MKNLAKVHRDISLEHDVATDIKKRTSKYSFNFSAWVNTTYALQFMSVSNKEKEICIHKQQIAQLEEEIKIIQDRGDTIRSNMNTNEKRYLEQVPEKIRNGAEWSSVLTYFNNVFNRDLSMQEFKNVVKVRDSDVKRQLGDRLNYFKSE